MRRKETNWIVNFCVSALLASPAVGQQQGGRYDAQIRARAAKVLTSNKDYKNVKAEVEDGIVTLTGDVELHSMRRGLMSRVHHIPHVAGVENQIVLVPAAVPDNILYGRVQTQLQDAGYGTLTFQVHEGSVILRGMVRNRHDWEAVRQLVSSTPGVKEVEARLSIAE